MHVRVVDWERPVNRADGGEGHGADPKCGESHHLYLWSSSDSTNASLRLQDARDKQTLTEEQATRRRAAQSALDNAQAQLHEVVRDLLTEGASIRELAAAAEIFTNTVQKWKRRE